MGTDWDYASFPSSAHIEGQEARNANRQCEDSKRYATQQARRSRRAVFQSIAPKRLLGYIRTGPNSPGAGSSGWKSAATTEDIPCAAGTRSVWLTTSRSPTVPTSSATNRRTPPPPSGTPAADASGGARALTVRDAVEQHRDFAGRGGNKTERAKQAAYNSLRWHVLCEDAHGNPRPGMTGLGDVPVKDLTTEMLVAFRDAVMGPKGDDERAYRAARATALRVWSNFRSCLEQAYRKSSNGVPSADAWRNVPTLSAVGNRREMHFSLGDALRIIENARANGDAAAADLSKPTC